MRHLATLLVHLIGTALRLLSPGGSRSVVAESVLLKHQLLILNRSRQRAPNLKLADRLIAGRCALMIRPTRLPRTAVVLKPSTLMGFHRALVKRKYRRLFTPKHRGTPGPKGPSPELVDAILEMKRRNPLFLFHRWRANLRILQIREIKSVPYVPLSHPLVERVIETIRRVFLDQVPYRTSTDLERKLSNFTHYYNRERAHRALGGNPPVPSAMGIANIHSVTWQSHCRRLYQLPSAA
jgi:hypothetical protein